MKRRGLHIALWIAQVLLALAFGMAGFPKLTQSIASLSAQMPWASSMPVMLVRFIGLAEVAGALGVILPAATRIRPGLTPLAALGLATIMVLAAAFHISRAEYQVLPVHAILGGLAVFVAWGRSRKVPIARGV